MLVRLPFSLLAMFFLISQTSCQNKTEQTTSTKRQNKTSPAANGFFKQVSQLTELKLEEMRVDSIRKISKIPVKVSVEIIDSSFLAEDKGKNVSLAFINEQYPYDRLVMYTIRFDKNKNKIISISKEKKSFERSVNSGVFEDIPLKKTGPIKL